jgi:hypothetical protein
VAPAAPLPAPSSYPADVRHRTVIRENTWMIKHTKTRPEHGEVGDTQGAWPLGDEVPLNQVRSPRFTALAVSSIWVGEYKTEDASRAPLSPSLSIGQANSQNWRTNLKGVTLSRRRYARRGHGGHRRTVPQE